MTNDNPRKQAAYQLKNGGYILVEQAENGWHYGHYSHALEMIQVGNVEGFAFPHQVRDYVLDKGGVSGISTVEVDYDDLKAQVDRASATAFPPVVFPFLDREKRIDIDTNVEPVVTIDNNDLPELPGRLALPLHIADKLFTQLEQDQIHQFGKRDKKLCPRVDFHIDYRIKGQESRYNGHFFPGSGNGGLLLHMERAANRRQYYLQHHPEQEGMEVCTQILDTMIPACYQQSIRAENRIMDKILPQPVPLFNVTHDEAVDNPSIGAKAFYASHRETARCADAMNQGLERTFRHRATYQFLDGMNREFGPERVRLVLARTVQLKGNDQRIKPDNKAYAAAVPVRNASENAEADMTRSYVLNVHPVVIDGVATAFRKMEQVRTTPRRERQAASKAKPARKKDRGQEL